MTKTIYWLPGLPNSQNKNKPSMFTSSKNSVCKTSIHYKISSRLIAISDVWSWHFMAVEQSRLLHASSIVHAEFNLTLGTQCDLKKRKTHYSRHSTGLRYDLDCTCTKTNPRGWQRNSNAHVRTCYSLEQAQRKSHINEALNCKITGINHQSLLLITQQLKQSMIKTRHKFFLPKKSLSNAHSDMNVYVL